MLGLIDFHFGQGRHARHQAAIHGLDVLRFEDDLDRHALDDLGEVAGGVIGRQQGELGARGRREAVDGAEQGLARHGVDLHADVLARLQVGQLGFLEVGGQPDVLLHDGGQLLARLDALAHLDGALADAAGDRRDDAVVAELLLGVLQLHAQHVDLGLEDVARGAGGADLGLGGAGAVALGGQVGHGAGAAGVGGVQLGLGDGLHLAVVQLAVALGVLFGAQQLGFRLGHLGAGGAGLGLHLGDLRLGLHHLLLGAGDLRLDLLDLDLLVDRVQLGDDVALAHQLVVLDQHAGDHARNAR